jgi:hypothetical protein
MQASASFLLNNVMSGEANNLQQMVDHGSTSDRPGGDLKTLQRRNEIKTMTDMTKFSQ